MIRDMGRLGVGDTVVTAPRETIVQLITRRSVLHAFSIGLVEPAS
jgi:hypothetical protein